MTGQGGMKGTREGKGRERLVIGVVTGAASRAQGRSEGEGEGEGALQRPCLAAAQQHRGVKRGAGDETSVPASGSTS